ncbi:MAG: TIGR00180 family glycosyltransferase [Lachnospiraceae bacterium]|nr:TIGR00180 family glycosyltransferase [Lachnospiraceae bacterium]
MDCVYETYEGKDLSQLQKVTLVIPTHNRNYYLSRCLWYHAHFPFAEIIVADSSDESKRRVNHQTISEIQQMFSTKITYLEYDFPAEEYGGEIYRKWGDAVSRVETEFSLSCTDKEFLIPMTIAKSVMFLDEHPDYSIADGRYYMMKAMNLVLPWQGVNTLELTSNDVLQRLNGLLNSNVPIGTQFALQRSKIHKSIFSNMDTYNLYDLRFGETEIELFPILYGKLMRCPDAMSLRDITQNIKMTGFNRGTIVKSESSYLRYPWISDYPKVRYEKYLNSLTECLINNSDEKVIEKVIEKVFHQRYLGTDLDEGKMKHPLLNKSSFMRYIWKKLPYEFKVIISKYFGSGMVEPRLRKNKMTKEIKIIIRLIKSTSKYYETDSIVHHMMGDIR